MIAHKDLKAPGSSDCCRHRAHRWFTDIYAGKTLIYIIWIYLWKKEKGIAFSSLSVSVVCMCALTHTCKGQSGGFQEPSILCVMGIWSACMSMYHTNAWLGQAWRGQKRALDLLELELQTIVSCCVGPGNHTWVLPKSCHCFNCWAISPTGWCLLSCILLQAVYTRLARSIL